MKRRYAAGLALALVGILSGCGQTQAADNTMHLAPVEFSAEQDELIRLTGMSTTADKFFMYEFSGNHTDANGMEIHHYIWKDKQWTPYKGRDGLVAGAYEMDLNGQPGKIALRRDGDINANFAIEVRYPDGSWSHMAAEPKEIEGLVAGENSVAVGTMEEPIDDLAVGVETPILIRVYRKGDTLRPVTVAAFNDPENSGAVQESVYAEAYTVIFVDKDM